MMPNKKTLTDLYQDITERALGDFLTEKDKSALAATSRRTQGLFQHKRLQMMADKLLLQVMHGEQDKAERILKIRPELLEMIGEGTDYSGRKFKTTAFRYALWALDTRYMCNMMLDCLSHSPQGEIIRQGLVTQYREHMRDGLDYELNGVAVHETHYNFSSLIAALQTYVNEYDNWYRNNNWDAMDNHWRKVVGLAQRYVPAHVAQHYCNPEESFSPTPKFNKKTFTRSLAFYNYLTGSDEFWFSPAASTAGLGVNFGIARDIARQAGAAAAAVAGIWWAAPMPRRRELLSVDLAAVTALCKVRTEDLDPLMQRIERLIQKPDVDPDRPSQCGV